MDDEEDTTVTYEGLMLAIFEKLVGHDVSDEQVVELGKVLFKSVEPVEGEDKIKVIW